MLVLFGFLWLLFDRWELLRNENQIDSVSSRESAFVANNWLFVGITFATVWGTYFGLFSEILTGEKIALSKPFFDAVNGPLFLLLLLLMGIGPLLGWRRTSMESLRNQLTWPLAIALVTGAIFAFESPRLYPSIGITVCMLVFATIIQEFVRGVSARRAATGENPLLALVTLVRRNGQRYGGYIVHLGIVLLGVAIIGNEFYQSTKDVTLSVNESVEVAGYTFTFAGMETDQASNRTEYRGNLALATASGRSLGVISPQRNIYAKTPDQPTSEVGLRMRPSEDIYVVLSGWADNGQSATFKIYINPLTVWMWVGGVVLILGTLLCTWPHPARKEELVVGAVGVPA